jgi:hypothetical protein
VWVGPERHATLTDPSEDGIEVVLADEERVVLSGEVHARFRKVEGERWIDIDRDEDPGGLRIIEPSSSARNRTDSCLSWGKTMR